MNKICLPVFFIAAITIAFSDAHAWRPSGWVWSQGPYAHATDTASWYYLKEGDQQLVYNYAPGGGWEFMAVSALASGWAWYSWPYAYDAEEVSWYYFYEQSEQWVHNASNDQWTRLGYLPASRSPLLTFVVAPSYSTGLIAREWVTAFDLVETSQPERSGSVLVVVQSSLSNPLNLSYDQLDALETDAFLTSSLLGRAYHVYRYDWAADGRLVVSYHQDYELD